MTDVSLNFAKHLSSLLAISHSKRLGLLSFWSTPPFTYLSMDSTIWQSFSFLKMPLLPWTKITCYCCHCLLGEVVKGRWEVVVTSLDVFSPPSLSKTILFSWLTLLTPGYPNSLGLECFLEKNYKQTLTSMLSLWLVTCFRLGPWNTLAATDFYECHFIDL